MKNDVEAAGPMKLRVGAGRAQIELPEELFPLEGFVGIHDPLHVRVLVVECGARVALVSIELTSLPKEYVVTLQKVVGQSVGVAPENVWVCVTHTMSAPHVRLTGGRGSAVGPATASAGATDDAKNAGLAEGIEDAVRDAARRAVGSLREARLGHASGLCDVNVNRDIPTAEGWWVGRNENGFSDKTLTVLRFEAMDGHPIALVFGHCVRPAATECSPESRENALVTADLAGVACTAVEKEYGDPTTALFFMGAAGDQTPRMREAAHEEAGREGERRQETSDEGGHAVAEMIGEHLGREVVRLSESIECRPWSGVVVATTVGIRFDGQEMPETRSIRPTKDHVFGDGPSRLECLEVISLGDVALVGASPELSCRTGVDIRDQSPFAETLILAMVNGAAKYMAEQTAYERMTYESMNSPFARGSAEKLAEHAVATLEGLWGEAGSDRGK